MAFISKAEREKRVSKLQSADVGKRIFILISIILAVTYIALLLIMQLTPFIPAAKSFSDLLDEGAWLVVKVDGSAEFTFYGLIMTIVTGAIVLMLIISFFIFLSMRSLKWGFKETVDLMKTPEPGVAGKYATKRTKKIVERRIAVKQLNKKNKKNK